MTLAEYHQLRPLTTEGGTLWVKPGARGYADPQYSLLAEMVEPRGQRALELNPGLGMVSLSLLSQGMAVEMIETSRAALRCLEKSFQKSPAGVKRGLPWETPEGEFDLAAMVLPANRGSEFTRLSLQGAAHALKMGGRLLIAGDKTKGFESYFREAQRVLGYGEIRRRNGALRAAVIEKEIAAPPPEDSWAGFSANLLGQELVFRHLPGVFSAGRVDPGSRLLLETIEPPFTGRLLDLGSGYGTLGLALAAKGLEATLLEDDWASVQSAQASAQANGIQASVLHSDVDEALSPSDRYDMVVTNAPFHLGGKVILDVARAFVAAAHFRLVAGGRFYLVANQLLPYEPLVEATFGNLRVRGGKGYKVLVASKG